MSQARGSSLLAQSLVSVPILSSQTVCDLVCSILHDRLFLACRSAVAELAPNAQGLVNAFGIPEHLVAAPIAADWETYNAVDNRGELLNIAF